MKIPFSFNPLGASKDSGGGMPTWNDYIAYISCDSYSETAETGQALTFYSVTSDNYTTYANIPCIDMTANARQWVRLTEPSINQGPSMPRSYSVWVAMTAVTAHARGLAIGSPADNCELASPNNYGSTLELAAGGWGNDTRSGTSITLGSWHHYVQQYYADGTLDLYLDGIQIAHLMNKSFNINSIVFALGWLTQDVYSTSYLRGYVSTARLWNRTLSDTEIIELASERTPHYQITASDLSFSLYQKNESYSISYSSPMAPTFEIIEGTLPNTISFNTSTGQFSGKGLTDADHTYNLKVRVTAPNSDPATCNVTIYTYKTARISLYNQSFSFISNKAESKSISYSSDESVTFTVESGTLPDGMTMSTGGTFSSSGTNTSAETQQVVVRATSANNQTGVTATMTLDMQMNAIVLNSQTLKFYTAQGVKTKAVKYSGSLNPVSDAVFSMTGTLPAGVTWDATTGSFTSDGTQSADETASVSVTVSSSNGSSTAATATMALEVHLGEPAVLNDMIWYLPFEDSLKEEVNDIAPSVNGTGFYEFAEKDSIPCVKCSSTGYSSEFFDYGETSKTILDIGTGDFSVSFWMAKNTLSWAGGSYNQIVIFGTQNSDFSTGLTLYQDGGNAGIDARISPGQSPLCIDNFSSTTAMPDENWHFWTFTRSGNTVKWYTDGVEVSVRTRVHGNTSNAECLFTPSMNFRIGYGQWSNCRPNYYLAALRIYDRVLEDSEIQALASEFTPTP